MAGRRAGRVVVPAAGRRAGEHQVLSEAEQAAVRQAVLDHTPSDLGLSGQLWTRGQIGRLIFKLYGVRFTDPGVGKYLKRWGLTFQRPDKRAVEQDPEVVRTWHEETWPAIRARAKADNGEILCQRPCSSPQRRPVVLPADGQWKFPGGGQISPRPGVVWVS
ncbi:MULTISPECIES: winged helix-turn-helix domain-containing protein [unclassified Streptomyces]|uniref:winged helix-turn-helix domain-containing protein n=1 Tax=unclassified Streptomyces TaxID=2593676 RepID=UPI003B634065